MNRKNLPPTKSHVTIWLRANGSEIERKLTGIIYTAYPSFVDGREGFKASWHVPFREDGRAESEIDALDVEEIGRWEIAE